MTTAKQQFRRDGLSYRNARARGHPPQAAMRKPTPDRDIAVLRVLTLSTLFPDETRPNFGIFVERQTLGLAARADVELRVVAPIGVPPWPLSTLSQYRGFKLVPEREVWKGLDVH